MERDLINTNGLILIDDVMYPDYSHSKGKYSIPYLIENGFELVCGEYQVLLKKKQMV